MSIDRRYALLKHSHDASDLTSGVLAPGRLGTGVADPTQVLRGDGVWAKIIGNSAAGVFGSPNLRLSNAVASYIELSDGGTRSTLIGADVGGGFIGTFSNHDFAVRANNVVRLLCESNSTTYYRGGPANDNVHVFRSSADVDLFSLAQTAPFIRFPNANTANTATAGAQSLPANPVGFLRVLISGTERKIPYYAV
jgi:hypothetical protein